jgi:hypothetical protein
MNRNVMPGGDVSEAESLAVAMARAYRQMAAFYRDQLELTGPDADARASGSDVTPEEAAADAQRIRERPADEVSWFQLARLAERDPAEAAAAWQRIRTAAHDELTSGHRTAQALEWQGGPWSRARFLALRDSFLRGTPPQSGIESALVDSCAEAFSDYLEWTEHLNRMASVDMEYEETRAERDGRWRPQRLSYAAAIENASRMAERAHARFLRTVKTLHEIRRMAANVYVSQAGQVNVGSQQVNITATPDDPDQ